MERIRLGPYTPLYDEHKREYCHLRQYSGYSKGRGGISKRISDCISASQPGCAMRYLETGLQDIHSCNSLRKSVRPHPLRDRPCLSDVFISRVTKIRTSCRWIDYRVTHSVCCSSAYGVRTSRTNCIRGGRWLTPWSSLPVEEDD